MYWASRRPTAWIRSVVPIVWRTHGEVAAQSPARGWAPPTTTTDRAPGRRSSGRCFSGAWASNAVASAMPQTVAPDLRATDLSVAVALGARSDITDRKSTRLNSSHLVISYAVFCLKKKKNNHVLHVSSNADVL